MQKRFTKEERENLQTQILCFLQHSDILWTAGEIAAQISFKGSSYAAMHFQFNDTYRWSATARMLEALTRKGLLVQGYGISLRGREVKAYMAA